MSSSTLKFQGFKKLFLGDEFFFNSYDSETLVMNFYVYGHAILRIEHFGMWVTV